MKITLNTILFIVLTALGSTQLNAQNYEADTVDYYNMSLEDLMNLEMTVASTKALSPRESPGVVTLITSDQIQNSGARDLIDILRLVPGFEFGVDVQGVVGLGMRGNWGHEGKILILMDGQEMNERNYATTQLGHHYPVDHIDRIEIIRGPGSATYGGYAELGVINIITKKGKTLRGGSVSTTYGQQPDVLGRASGSFMLGNASEDLSYDVKGFYQVGNRSDRLYTDIYGDSYSMKDNSELGSKMFNAGVEYKGLGARVIYEDHSIQQRDLFDAAMPEPVNSKFIGFYSELKYDLKLSEKVTITPRVRYKSQRPWQAKEANARDLDSGDFGGVFSDKQVTQTVGNVVMTADPSDKINFILGGEYYKDNGTTEEGHEYDFNGTTDISFFNYSFFGQGLFKLDFANITVGARFNEHEQFGSAFVPRVGVTKVFDNFHAKLLYSQAFRAPSIENINLNAAIKPELTTVFELEAGYKLTSKMLLTANIYSISIDDPIVYFYDDLTGNEGYDNYDGTGTMGFEIEYRYKDDWGSLALNYSNYTAGGDNKVDSYDVPTDKNRLVGLPQSKFNVIANISLMDNLSLSPTITYLGERSGFASVDVNDVAVVSDFDPALFLNLYLNYKNVFTKGLNIGAGVYNLTDNDYAFIQPYNNYHAPLPAPGREILVKLTYDFNF